MNTMILNREKVDKRPGGMKTFVQCDLIPVTTKYKFSNARSPARGAQHSVVRSPNARIILHPEV